MPEPRHRRRTIATLALPALTLLLLAGCGQEVAQDGLWEDRPGERTRVTDPDVLSRGEAIFQQNCASCHGERAEGAENWHQRNPDGTMPPPPLDDSAHAWHHPLWQLRDMISHGGELYDGAMPSFRDQLDDAEIDAVIAWFQSQWRDEVYQAWLGYDERLPTAAHWEEMAGETWGPRRED